MKALVLAAGALALSTAAMADTVTTTKEYGNYSSPTAGATPAARENPSPGTTVLREREKTTVTPSTTVVVRPAPTVIEERSAPTVVEERSETHVVVPR